MRIALAAVSLSLAAAFASARPGPYPTPTGNVTADVSAALAVARRIDDVSRVSALTAFRGRTFLKFDARGTGQAVEVLGDLEAATRIAVVVPGADNTLENYDKPKFVGASARNLYAQMRSEAPAVSLAVVAWLGYDSPRSISPAAVTTGRASRAARDLASFTDSLPSVPITLVCHSYGSVVCAKAAATARVNDLVLIGSPGVPAATASGLGTKARVWATRSPDDWIRYLPSFRLLGLGLGTDPTSPAFGARRLPSGTGPHSAYFTPGSEPLRALAHLALGTPTGAHHE